MRDQTLGACLVVGIVTLGLGFWAGWQAAPASVVGRGVDALAELTYDREAEARYNAQMAELEAGRSAAEAQAASAHAAVEQAEAEAERHRQDKASLLRQLEDAGREDEDRERQLQDVLAQALGNAEAGRGQMLVDLTGIWKQRVSHAQQIGRAAVEQAERERDVAHKLRQELLLVRTQLTITEQALKVAQDRVEFLSRPRFRWGPGAAVGVPIVPRVEFNRPTIIAGITFSWS